jgi:hypothetical protein
MANARAEKLGGQAAAAGERARHSTWVDRLARFGLVAKAASYALVAALALGLAFGAGGKATSREGALATLAGETWGAVVLVALAAGFAAYGLWRLLQALFDADDDGAKGLAKRAGYLGRAILYAGLTYATLKIAIDGRGGGSQTEEARRTTADAFGWPAGRWLVAGVGIGILAAAAYNGYRAVTQKFEEKWTARSMSRAERTWGARIGTVGHFARMVVFGLIGAFVLKAAVEYDPQEAIGLDGALRKLLDQAYGPVLLGVVAAGLLAYAVFCLVEARYRDV